MWSLLRPPSHRGPLIATAAVVLTVGVALQQIRLDWAPGWQALVTGSLAIAFLWLALQAPLEGGHPPAYQSVLIVCGLLALLAAIAWLLEAILEPQAEDAYPAPRMTALFALHAVASGLVAVRRNSGIATLLAALSSVGGVLSLWEWVFDVDSVTPFRWLLLVLALAYVVVSLVLRAPWPRASEQLVNAAGVAILAIPLIALAQGAFFFFGGFSSGDRLSGFWEVVVLAAGFGLVAYAAVDRTPGPAYLGAANLGAFAAVTSIGAGDTLEWWPLTLLVVGLLLLFVGLRPVRPLPPEPPAYRPGEVPLSVRVEGDETVIRVRE